MNKPIKFWLGKKGSGKGTLGEIKPGKEVPEGLLTPKRLAELEAEGSIGEKIVASNEGDDSKTAKIKELVSFLQDADLEIKNLNEKINGLEALNSKVEADEDLLRSYVDTNKDLEESNTKLASEKDQLVKDLASSKVKISKLEKDLTSSKAEVSKLEKDNKKLKAGSK